MLKQRYRPRFEALERRDAPSATNTAHVVIIQIAHNHHNQGNSSGGHSGSNHGSGHHDHHGSGKG